MSPDFVYLSPHLDDAVWSCGGGIARQASQGAGVSVLTVCAGDPPPDPPDTPLVRDLLVRSVPVTQRRAEDREALALLGARAVHLDVPDCVYRRESGGGRPLYPRTEALFGPLHPKEQPLVDEVVARLRRLEPLSGVIVLIPLAVGHHVDHQLVRAAAERWGAPGGQIAYYEDFPYAESDWALEAVMFEHPQTELVSRLVRLDPDQLARKQRAAACYRSQVALLFRDETEMSQRLHEFARVRAGSPSGLAERLWWPSQEDGV